ncbi:hypothetical protein ACFQ0B_36740 [Nonomuraea thailandensis]
MAEERGHVAGEELGRQGRSMSAVRPWPWISTAITLRLLARCGSSMPNEVPMPEKEPWMRTSGSPAPWTS